MIISRHWGMPSADTFDCQPIEGFVKKYLIRSKVSVDPFSRNKRWCTFTNDLNPKTMAEYHMEAADFLEMLVAKGITADLVIFDPPYSLTQVSRSYQEIGLQFKGAENPTGGFPKVRELISKILCENGVCLSFGWNSCGIGKVLGFEQKEIVLVCHGGNHNDTICVAEQKLPILQTNLFDATRRHKEERNVKS